MYLQHCTIRNIKCFEQITLDFRQPDGTPRLWNVIIGENGTGKTALLQAIAIALAGRTTASILLPRPVGWVRAGASEGIIEAAIVPGSFDTEVADAAAPEAARLGDSLQVRCRIQNRTSAVSDPLFDTSTAWLKSISGLWYPCADGRVPGGFIAAEKGATRWLGHASTR